MDSMNITLRPTATLMPHVLSKFSSDDETLTPFAISLSPWTVFNKAWTMIMDYPAEDFRFLSGQTPMSTFKETAALIVSYYLIIFGGQAIMRNKMAFKLHVPFIIHNYILTAISGSLLILFLQQLIPTLWYNGLFDSICGISGWTQPLLVLYYCNYLIKYLELLDTVFLVLKKKPLTLLHTYHHGATALLCYTQLVGETSISWIPITLNLTVHVVMYWYYAQAARGIRIWWKKYITTLQITQFVLDLGFIYFAVWTYMADTYIPSLPHVGSCGEPKQELAAFSGCAILSSYLVLFVMFYLSTYRKPAVVDKALQRASLPVSIVAGTDKKVTETVQLASHVASEGVVGAFRKT